MHNTLHSNIQEDDEDDDDQGTDEDEDDDTLYSFTIYVYTSYTCMSIDEFI